MQCPVCENSALVEGTLENELITHRCLSCEGHWIGLSDYQCWLDRKGRILPEKLPSGDIPKPINKKKIKICPHCDHLMMKYKLGSDSEVNLDHCHHCRGVWFDTNEWIALKDRQLHDEVYEILTESWQQNVRDEIAQQDFNELYTEKFGEADYSEIRRIKGWLYSHPKARELLAYLKDK